MPERSSIGLDATDIVAVRVAVELGQRLQEGGQIRYRYEPVSSKRDVESTRNVALGKDEPVPLGIIDVLGSDIENGPIERREDIDGGKVATDVAGSGVVDQLQILNADVPRGLGDPRDLLVAMPMWLAGERPA